MATGSNNANGGGTNDGLTLTLDDRRRAALAEIDNAKFSWFHFKVCMVASVGFFTDAYDIFAIDIVTKMLGFVYEKSGALSSSQELGLKVATPIGTLFGQILFGWLADRVGRKRMYGIELMIMMLSAFAQSLSGTAPATNIVGVLVVWRFIMGFGIGGDYPLSAIIVSEFSPVHIRGRLMTVVVASQGLGNFCASIVSLVVISAFKSPLLTETPTNAPSVDYLWRVLIGLGCVPATLGLYFRLTIPETPRFTVDIERNLDQARADIDTAILREEVDYNADHIHRILVPRASWHDFIRYFKQWNNFKVLFGTCYSWFAIDVAFYGLGLNSSTLVHDIFLNSLSGGTSGIYQSLRGAAAMNLVMSAAGLIPGYWVSFAFIDCWGRKAIQIMGFSVLAVLFIVTGAAYDRLTATGAGKKATIFLYCLANFFQNFGPNTTTFIIPGEVFPTRYRSTCHGIAAASGKLGATVSLIMFSELKKRPRFFSRVLEILVVFMVTGIGSTLLLPETKGRTLEDLSNERQRGFVQASADGENRMTQQSSET